MGTMLLTAGGLSASALPQLGSLCVARDAWQWPLGASSALPSLDRGAQHCPSPTDSTRTHSSQRWLLVLQVLCEAPEIK